MGQKINITTLRSNKLQFNSFSYNITECLYLYSFLKIFEFFFWQKKIFLTKFFFFNSHNKIFFTFFIFFRVAYVNNFLNKKYIFKTNVTKSKSSLKKLKSNKTNNLNHIFTSLNFFKKNLIIFKIVTLNKYLKRKKKKIKILNSFFKQEASLLFPRRYNFFLDFLQLSILFLENQISISFFIKIITEIFRILQKKRHSRFIIFINSFFNFLLCRIKNLQHFFKNFKSIAGIKFVISGKLKGKPRSSHYTKVFGSVPIQTLNCSIEYAKSHAFTIYGVFGIHIWIQRIIK